MLFGKIELAQFEELDEKCMTQKVASAWSAIKNPELVGASYKPLLYCGVKTVRGVNHVFIAEQTLITNPPVRHLVLMEVNEFGNHFELVPSSIVEIL